MSETERHPSVAHFDNKFEWAHLREGTPRMVVQQFAAFRDALLTIVPDSPETAAGLRKLVEAKDCMVRAVIDAEG